MNARLGRHRLAATVLLLVASAVALDPVVMRGVAQSQPTILRGGTLAVTLSSEPVGNFDPLRQTDGGSGAVTTNVLEPLVRLDEQLRPVPWLASAFEQPDPLTYVFKLRSGVRFHDGTLVDAEAVKFSVDRIRTDPAATDFAATQVIAESTVVDPETYLVRLREPYAPFLTLLAGRPGLVVSPAAVRSQGADDFNRNPVGTGPFRSIQYQPGRLLRVERFDGYWRTGADGRPLPYLDAVEWRIMTDPDDRFEALLDGVVQIADILIHWDEFISDDPDFVVANDPTGGFSYGGLLLTLDRPPFDNRALRQAVAFAINRTELIDYWYGGGIGVAHGPIPPAIGWAVDPTYRPYVYDPVSAILKLQEAGYPNGFSFEAWSLESEAELIDLIAFQLAEVGIEMHVRLAPNFGVLQMLARDRAANAYLIGFGAGADPDFAVSRYVPGSAFKHFPYDNPRVTALVEEARRTVDFERRGALYRQITPLIMEDSPYIFLFGGNLRFVGSNRVQGWALGVRATSGYAEYWLAP